MRAGAHPLSRAPVPEPRRRPPRDRPPPRRTAPAAWYDAPMRHRTRHFPFAAVGLVLIVVSVAPTVIGMVRSFNQMQRGDAAAAAGTSESSVALAFHPAFVACGLIGLL